MFCLFNCAFLKPVIWDHLRKRKKNMPWTYVYQVYGYNKLTFILWNMIMPLYAVVLCFSSHDAVFRADILCFVCLPSVSWLLCDSSSQCHGVIVVFPVHTHYFQSRTPDWPIWKAIVTSLTSTGLLFADKWVLYIHFMTVLPCKKNSLA